MAPELFVDTSAWYPLVDRSAPGHARLAAVLRERITGGWTLVMAERGIGEALALDRHFATAGFVLAG